MADTNPDGHGFHRGGGAGVSRRVYFRARGCRSSVARCSGEVSIFSLELPPYRPPRLLRTLYTSLIDRTIFVLWRAVVFALPAGAVIWLSANLRIGSESLAS